MPRQHCQRSPKHAARQCEVVTIHSPRLLIIHEIKGHWQDRRSGYPFSGPRSRCTGLANWLWLINTVFGVNSLWQAQMVPAPGHPNHLPNSGLGAALKAKTPPSPSRWAVGFAGAGPICGCPPGNQPNIALTQQRQHTQHGDPRAWAGERNPRRPPARGSRQPASVTEPIN